MMTMMNGVVSWMTAAHHCPVVPISGPNSAVPAPIHCQNLITTNFESIFLSHSRISLHKVTPDCCKSTVIRLAKFLTGCQNFKMIG